MPSGSGLVHTTYPNLMLMPDPRVVEKLMPARTREMMDTFALPTNHSMHPGDRYVKASLADMYPKPKKSDVLQSSRARCSVKPYAVVAALPPLGSWFVRK